MRERILDLARSITGAGEAELPVLEALCAAAEAQWRGRLRGDAPEEVLACAAAFLAAADLTAGRGGGSGCSFTAGDISVKGREGAENAAASAELRRTAERLMAPYACPGDVCLKGVRG